MICQNCGTRAATGVVVCRFCGYQVSNQVVQTQTIESQNIATANVTEQIISTQGGILENDPNQILPEINVLNPNDNSEQDHNLRASNQTAALALYISLFAFLITFATFIYQTTGTSIQISTQTPGNTTTTIVYPKYYELFGQTVEGNVIALVFSLIIIIIIFVIRHLLNRNQN